MANVKHIEIDGVVYDVVPSGSYVTGVKGSNESAYRSGNVNITKANVGLSNVPNVTTNNQAPTFTQATIRANIASGETLKVILGKVMKFFADLKTVAFSGSYTDLSNKPTIPTKTSELSNDSGFIVDTNQYGSNLTAASGLTVSGTPFKIGNYVFCNFTCGTSFTNDAVIATLPTDYRPSALRAIGGVGSVGDSNLATMPCYFTVNTNGQIVIHAPQSKTYYYCTGHLAFLI